MIKRGQLKAVGKRIYDLRKKSQLTQGQLAERSDLTTNYIGKIERGESQPTLDALLSISTALRANPSSLFLYLDRPPSREETKERIRDLLEHL